LKKLANARRSIAVIDLYVNEIFYSVQGEGGFTGCPAVFVRLQGCSVRCPWCDTKYTWKEGKHCRIVPIADVFKKDREPHCAKITDLDLADQIASRYPQAPLIVLTGGEPLEQDVSGLCERLLGRGYMVSVETSGSQAIRLPKGVFITVSPKIHSPCGALHPSALPSASELKYVIGNLQDIQDMRGMLKDLNPDALIYLQPLSMSEEATRICIDEICGQGARFRLSLQTEKFVNIR
jgi:7-carboxy-7-deazaguanine synthase